MRGHLEERGKNVWRAKVYLGLDAVTGRKRYITRTVRGPKRQAEDALNRLLLESGDTSQAVVDGTFSELAAKWFEQASTTLSPSTQAEYRRLLDRIIVPRFGSTKVRSIRASDLDAFYSDLHKRGTSGRPLGAQSIQHVHALIRRLLNQAVKWDWVTTNPATKASPPKVHAREMELPTPEAVVRVLAGADARDPDLGCFLRLSVVTGARRGELCALRWSDIDPKAGTLRISRSIVGGNQGSLTEKSTKTHAARRVCLDEATLTLLADRLRALTERAQACGVSPALSAFVFSDAADASTPWRPNRVTLAFVRLCRQLDVPGVRLHDLRHFAATQMLAAGIPVRTVAGRLGHAKAATTLNVYAHVLESSDASAAQVLAELLNS